MWSPVTLENARSISEFARIVGSQRVGWDKESRIRSALRNPNFAAFVYLGSDAAIAVAFERLDIDKSRAHRVTLASYLGKFDPTTAVRLLIDKSREFAKSKGERSVVLNIAKRLDPPQLWLLIQSYLSILKSSPEVRCNLLEENTAREIWQVNFV